MTGENRLPSEVFWEDSEDYCDKEAAANLLRETKSTLFAKICLEKGDIPVSKAELQARADPRYEDHILKMVEAEDRALRAKLKVDYDRMRSIEWNSQEANHRAGARL